MKISSFCAFAGVALLAGQVFGDSAPEVDDLDAAANGDEVDAYNGMLTDEQEKEFAAAADTSAFQAEVSRMMKMIINSLYKNKEIFLRELISNASDALDKIRFLSLQDRSQLDSEDQLRIRIRADTENHILHIEDTGIGMTKEELVKNLGTIARSGTSEFMSAMDNGQDAEANNLIGQFGVGFYSSFLVADKVTVTSKSNKDGKQYMWTSDAETYTIAEDPRGDEHKLTRGTCISLHLKPEAHNYLEGHTLRNLVRRYSEFINFPIELYEEVEREIEYVYEDDEDADVDADADADQDGDDDDDGEVEDDGAVEDDQDEDEPKTEMVWDYVQMNSQKPIWVREPKDVSEEEYKNFYQSISRDHGDPLARMHFTAEGEVRFKSVIFVPSARHHRMQTLTQIGGEISKNIKIYVRRVFIADEFSDFIPKYLQFIHGIVDSDDLPLNVSRENLQAHRLMKVIKKKLVRKMLQMLQDLADSDPEAYLKLFKSYADQLKMGLIEDGSNRNRLAKLLRFRSSNADEDTYTSLEEYVERMREGQPGIYFIACKDIAECEASPFAEQLLADGYEVLYMTDAVDEYAIQNMPEFAEKQFVNVAKDNLKFDENTEENEARRLHFEELEEEFEPTTSFLSDQLGEVVDRVVVSTRLANTPCVLVASASGWTGNMERVMMAQPNTDHNAGIRSRQKRTLEINARHPLIRKLHEGVLAKGPEVPADDEEENENGAVEEKDETLSDLAQVLLDTAMIRSGYTVRDSPAFAHRVERFLRLSMGVDLGAAVEVLPDFEGNPVVIEMEEEDAELDVDEAPASPDVDDGDDEDLDDAHDEL